MDTKMRRRKQAYLFMLIQERERVQLAINRLEIELAENKLGNVETGDKLYYD